jgi:hypothetical protein
LSSRGALKGHPNKINALHFGLQIFASVFQAGSWNIKHLRPEKFANAFFELPASAPSTIEAPTHGLSRRAPTLSEYAAGNQDSLEIVSLKQKNKAHLAPGRISDTLLPRFDARRRG